MLQKAGVGFFGIGQGMRWQVQFHEFDPPQPYEEDNISQLVLNTVDGFPEVVNQEWNQVNHWQNQNYGMSNKIRRSNRHQEGIFEEYPIPFHWDEPENHCDPPYEEEFYIDPPHEWG